MLSILTKYYKDSLFLKFWNISGITFVVEDVNTLHKLEKYQYILLVHRDTTDYTKWLRYLHLIQAKSTELSVTVMVFNAILLLFMCFKAESPHVALEGLELAK